MRLDDNETRISGAPRADVTGVGAWERSYRGFGIAKILKKRQLHTRQGCHQVDVGNIVSAMIENLSRPDLQHAGIGDARCTFDLSFPLDSGYEIAVQDGQCKIPSNMGSLNAPQAQEEDQVDIDPIPRRFQSKVNMLPRAITFIRDALNVPQSRVDKLIDIGLSPVNFQSKKNILPRAIHIIRLDPNDNCNLRCVYCHNYRSEKLIDLNEFREFVNTGVDTVGTFQIGCAMEPTLDSRLCDFAEAIAGSKARPYKNFILQTNGLLLHRHDYRRLAGAGINLVSISIDVAEPETQKALRGRMSLEKLLRNVKDFRERCPSVSMGFIATVTTANVEKVESLVTLGLEYGISQFTFREVFYFPDNPIVDHSRMSDLVLAAGQFEAMRTRILRKFGNETKFIFANSNTLLRYWRNMERKRSR